MSGQVNNENLEDQNNNVPSASEQPMFSSDANQPNQSENVFMPYPPSQQTHFMMEQTGETQSDGTLQDTNAVPEPAYEPLICSCASPACQARQNQMYQEAMSKPQESSEHQSNSASKDAAFPGATEQNVVQQEPVYQARNSMVFLQRPRQEQPGHFTIFRPDIPTSSAQVQEQPQPPQAQEQPTVMPVISQQVAFVAQPSTIYVTSPTFITIPVVQQAISQQGIFIPGQTLSPGQQILIQPVMQLPQGVVSYGLVQLGGDKIPAHTTQQTEESSEEVDEQSGEVDEQSGEVDEQSGEVDEQSEEVDEPFEVLETVPEPVPQVGKRVVRIPKARNVSLYRLSPLQRGEHSNMSRRNCEPHCSHQQYRRCAASAKQDEQEHGFEDYEGFDKWNHSAWSLKVTINNNGSSASQSSFQKPE